MSHGGNVAGPTPYVIWVATTEETFVVALSHNRTAGDIITVTARHDDGWAHGVTTAGRRGAFPLNFTGAV